ncbi:MAG: EAL domain-containing protein [Rubrivivax sp.]
MPRTTAFLPTHYDPVVVLLSILVAALASFTALDLARRIRQQEHGGARAWVLGGALVMGSGIWSMHFVGMLAMSLPIEIGFAPGITFASWLAAVAVSALALCIASRDRLGGRTLGLGALAMGGGICAMHYTGMAAIDLAPGIVWHPGWVAASVLVACGTAAVALLIFFGMRRLSGLNALAAQASAAVVMGLAISGMHYTGMAAASFPAGAVCLSVGGLGGHGLGLMVLVAVAVVLSMTLFTTALDARLQARAARLAHSLSVANAELQRRAFFDPLTGVPNRALLEDRLLQSARRAERGAQASGGAERLALLFIDLDGFKPVNDVYGHAAGDAVLRQVAERLGALVRESDTLARLGGDEFVLLFDGVAGAAEAVAAARRALDAMAVPFEAGGRAVTLSASIGIVLHPGQAEADHLLASADAAMYAAKRAGGATCAMFEPRMGEGAATQLELVQDLRQALAAGQLSLQYQPKVDAHSGRVRGAEALLRWQHPVRGMVSPAVFVPLAERFGLIVPIGAWVLEETCRQLAQWARAGRRLRVSINLSAYELRQGDLARRVGQALARHGLPPDQLVCEITESAAMEDTETTRRLFADLAALGVKVSIDDFGTGYSSLAKLRRLRAHELKIDREFVGDLATSADARAVVEAIVHLGRALGLRIVAEGVETAAQRQVLCSLGCDELQGYLFAKPMPPQALLAAMLPDPAAEGPLDFSPSVLMEAGAAA